MANHCSLSNGAPEARNYPTFFQSFSATDLVHRIDCSFILGLSKVECVFVSKPLYYDEYIGLLINRCEDNASEKCRCTLKISVPCVRLQIFCRRRDSASQKSTRNSMLTSRPSGIELTCEASTFYILLGLYFFLFFPSHLLFLPFFFSLPPSRNSDPGSHGRLLSPLPATVRALHFLTREECSPFFLSSPCVELRLWATIKDKTNQNVRKYK